jgi:hypothetical protein
VPVYRVINYTDYHDVDEDKVSIIYHGGHWNGGWSYGSSGVGIADRSISPSSTFTFVASSNMKNSHITRISIMSTKI